MPDMRQHDKNGSVRGRETERKSEISMPALMHDKINIVCYLLILVNDWRREGDLNPR